MSEQEIPEVDWANTDPSAWPHTPPLNVFRKLLAEKRNLFWKVPSGHIENFLEDALDELDELEEERSKLTSQLGRARGQRDEESGNIRALNDALVRAESAEAVVERVRAILHRRYTGSPGYQQTPEHVKEIDALREFYGDSFADELSAALESGSNPAHG